MGHLHGLDPAIVHRGLTSSNVLLAAPLNSNEQLPLAKVSDFGLARMVDDVEAFKVWCARNWRWTAPEMLKDGTGDKHADVFSFGMLMFEVLAREVPYADKWPVTAEADTEFNKAIGMQIANGHRPRVELVHKGCPALAIHLMEACWESDPNKRPDFAGLSGQLQSQLDLVTLYHLVKPDVQSF